MPSMNTTTITGHRIKNQIQTGVMIAGMLLIMGVLGLLFAGTFGLMWALIIGGFFLMFSGQMSPDMILRINGARPLNPYQSPQLFQLTEQLARRANLGYTPKLYVVPTQMMNAFAVGGRDNAGIGLTSGILRNLTPRELSGVLAHEISHIKNNDMRTIGLAAMISRMTNLFAFIGQILLFVNMPLLLIGQATFSWFGILLLIAAPRINTMIQLALSRTREYDADMGAVQLTGDPEGLASALGKLEMAQHSWFQRMMPGQAVPNQQAMSTHPQTKERVSRLLNLIPNPAVQYA